MASNQAQEILLQLRGEYVAQLPAICDVLEGLVSQLDDTFQTAFEEMYRCLYPIRGNAALYGMGVISSVCFNMEALLEDIGGQGGASEDQIALLRKSVALLREIAMRAASDNASLNDIESEIDQLRKHVNQDLTPIILLESSRIIVELCKEALKGLPVKLVVENDGLETLTKLVRNKYAVLITANEVKSLNGLALIGAVRASDGANKRIKTVLLTSRDSLPEGEYIKPDYVVNRNTALADSLVDVVKEIIA